jgi:Carboxypeptidase regulatory-like domain
LTHEAAALRLGRPVGTVHSRLATARERLKARLTRRGLAPAVLPAFDLAGGGSVVVPAALEEATLRGSLKAAIGKTSLAGISSAEAIALMETTMKSMMIGRAVVGTAALLAAILFTAGVGVMAYSGFRLENGSGPGGAAGAAAIVLERNSQEKARVQTPARAAELPAPSPAQKPAAKGPSGSSGPILIEVETVDSQGKPLSGVAVGVSVSYAPRRLAELSGMVRSMTDEHGKAPSTRVEVTPGEQARSATIWAYKPGRALGLMSLSIAEKSSVPVRLTLDEPVNQTIRVVWHEGRPIDGVRVVPRLLQTGPARSVTSIPDGWRDELARTTDENGAVTITTISRTMKLLTVQLSGSGIAQHTVEVPEADGEGKCLIKLGKPGRLVGVVRNESGEPMVDVPVDVWVRASGSRPRGRRRATPTEAVEFDSAALRTGPLGEFRTPAALLQGSSYRVSIRREGFAPFLSKWVELAGERTTFSAIRLRALRKLIGSVRDRQGGPVAGARVFLPSGEPTTTTDAVGRFELAGIEPGKTFVLVQRPGFRFQGWPLDVVVAGDLTPLTLARTSEPPEQVVAPQPDLLADSEFKALGEQLLESCVKVALAREDDLGKQLPLLKLVEFAPERVPEILDRGEIKNPIVIARLRGELAIRLAGKDFGDARAEVTAIADPRERVNSLVRLAEALPKSAENRKRAILEDAIVQARGLPAVFAKVVAVGPLIKGLIDFGMLEPAKLLANDGLKILDSRPPGDATFASLASGFLAQIARLDTAQAQARIQKISDQFERDRCLGAAAIAIAVSQPADAEQFFRLIEQRSGQLVFSTALPLCKRLGKVDLARAHRIAEGIAGPGTRACAWVFVALGAFGRDKRAATAALDRSLEAIDQILESGPGPDPIVNLNGVNALYPTNPAAELLPLVERIAPERLAEFFWRAVALHERINPDDEDRLQRSAIGKECMLLAHYNRDAAAVLFGPMNSYIQSVVAEKNRNGEVTPSALKAKACIEPKAGVELLDTLAVGLTQSPIDGSFEARLSLAKAFTAPAEERWTYLWTGVAWKGLVEDE